MCDERDGATCSRRRFLQASGGAAATLLALGIDGATAIAFVDAEKTTTDERRYPIPAADGVTIDRRAQVMLVRAHGVVFALALACPHQNAAVKWLAAEQRFQCSRHDSKYTPDGVYTSGRATRNLDRFPVRIDNGGIMVDVTRVFRSDQDPAGWKGAQVMP